MEAATLKKKKPVNKGKLKKTIKNVLCRPDKFSWPVLSDDKEQNLLNILNKYKMDIVDFKKLHWSQLKDIPKENRPKPAKLKKVQGLLFGINECSTAIENKICKAILLDADIEPRILVQHIIDSCKLENVPIGCLKGLKQNCSLLFGFPTCCLGVTDDKHVLELKKAMEELPIAIKSEVENDIIKEIVKTDTINTEANKALIAPSNSVNNKEPIKTFTYLYRTSKTTRAFIPPSKEENAEMKVVKDFSGQNFIGMSKKPESKSNKLKYTNMTVKKITNNPNRKRKNK